MAAVAVLSTAHVAVPGGAGRPDSGLTVLPRRGGVGEDTGRDLPPAAAAVIAQNV